MHFCRRCDNMMHINLNVADSSSLESTTAYLTYKCPHCGELYNPISTEGAFNSLVYSIDYDDDEQANVDVINEFMQYDPTLPTTDAVTCPNEGCSANVDRKDGDSDLDRPVYIRHNKSDLKYVYMCRKCNTTWTSINFE